MLRLKSIDDIRYVPIYPEKEKIDIAPNLLNVFYGYSYNGSHIPFVYNTISEDKRRDIKEDSDIIKRLARSQRAIYRSKDQSKDIISFPFYFIELWEKIPTEFRDVFIMHELSEIQHKFIGKQARKTAHERAVRKTDDYLKRYFSFKEILRFK